MLLAVETSNSAPSGWTFYRFLSERQSRLPLGHLHAPSPDRDSSVPLPGTLSLLGAGLAGLGFARRKAQR